MKYATDANFVIDVLHGEPQAIALHPTLLADGLGLSILVYMELLDGVYGNQDPKAALVAFRTLLRGLTILPFSPRVAQRAARLRRELRVQKKPLNHRALDILIAATALHYNLIMVTSDTDYADIPSLTTLNPRTGQLNMS